MKSVLVLDACQRSALAVTRALGAHGLQVFTADETASALAGCSRYSGGYFSYPSPRTDPGSFTDAIKQICRSQAIDLLLPMTELTGTLLLAERARLPAHLPFAAQHSIDLLADKCSLFRLAESLQVPTPECHYFESLDESFAILRLKMVIDIRPKNYCGKTRYFHSRPS